VSGNSGSQGFASGFARPGRALKPAAEDRRDEPTHGVLSDRMNAAETAIRAGGR
jgi:hypothetical protein